MSTIVINTALVPEDAAQAFFEQGYRQTSRRHRLLARVDIDDVAGHYRELGYFALAETRTDLLEDHYRRCTSTDKIELPGDDAHKEWSEAVMTEVRELQNLSRGREWAITYDPTTATIEQLLLDGDIERLAKIAVAQMQRAQSAEACVLNLNPTKSLYEINIWSTDIGWEELEDIERVLAVLGLELHSQPALENISAESGKPVPSQEIFDALRSIVDGAEVSIKRFDLLDIAMYNKSIAGTQTQMISVRCTKEVNP